jgi:hypothetical protein
VDESSCLKKADAAFTAIFSAPLGGQDQLQYGHRCCSTGGPLLKVADLSDVRDPKEVALDAVASPA